MKVTQDQKNFSMGQVNPAFLAEYSGKYQNSCKVLQNCLVNLDGSVQLRDGFDLADSLDPLKQPNEEILEVVLFEKHWFYLYRYGPEERAEDRKTEVRYSEVVTSQREKTKLLFNFNDWSGLGLDNHGLDVIDRNKGKIIRIKVIKDRLFVFFENGFPYVVGIENSAPVARPYFWVDREDAEAINDFKRYNIFPCSRTRDSEKKSWGRMTISDVNWSERECSIKFENNPDLNSLIGHPIHFNIRKDGNEEEVIDPDDVNTPQNWTGNFGRAARVVFPDLNDVIDSLDDSVLIREVASNLNSIAFNESAILPSRPLTVSGRFFFNPSSPSVVYGTATDTSIVRSTTIFKYNAGGNRETVFKIGKTLIYPYDSDAEFPGPYYYFNRGFFLGNSYVIAVYENRLYRTTNTHHNTFFLVMGSFDSFKSALNSNPNPVRYSDDLATTNYLVSLFPGVRVLDDDRVSVDNDNPLYLFYQVGRSSRYSGFFVSGSYLYAFRGGYKNSFDRWNFNFRNSGYRILSNRQTFVFPLSFNHFYPLSSGYVVSQGSRLIFLDSSGNYQTKTGDASVRKQYILNRNITGFDGTNVYGGVVDNKIQYKPLSFFTDQNIYVPPPPPATEEEKEAARRAEELRVDAIQRRLRGYKVKEVFAGIGFRFFTVFPYEVDGGKLKCRIYETGFKVSNRFNEGLGGAFLDGSEDSTDNYTVSDWYNGFPVDGGNIAGKDFMLTSGGQLSYSKVNKRSEYGSPIKVLFNSSGFFYKIGDAKYTDIQSVDIPPQYRTEPIRQFFQEVDREEERVLFSLGDPFTYDVRIISGEKVKFFSFHTSEIGAFASAGAQTFALTDKGVFYWGLNPNPQGVSSYVFLSKVSNFLGSARFKAIDEVQNVVFVSDSLGDIYAVRFNEKNRNFVGVPCGTSVDFKNVDSSSPYQGNRLLVVDSVTKKLYVANVEKDGMLSGVSEWVIPGLVFERVYRFDNDNYVLANRSDEKGRVLLKLGNDEGDNFGEGPEPFNGIIESAPLTVSPHKNSMHDVRCSRENMETTVFSKNLENLDIFDVDKGDYESLRSYSMINEKFFPRIFHAPVKFHFNPGDGVRMRLIHGTQGTLGGVSSLVDCMDDYNRS